MSKNMKKILRPPFLSATLALCIVGLTMAGCGPTSFEPVPTPLMSPLASSVQSNEPADPLAGYDLVYAEAMPSGSRLVLRLQDGTTRVLSQSGSVAEPAWSPDGQRIAYTSGRQSGNYEIFIVDRNGNQDVPLLKRAFGYTWAADWSPDGTQILFSSNVEGLAQLYVVDLDGTTPRALTEPNTNSFFARWSPDGKRIAFTSDRSGSGDNEIFVMNGDGSQVQQLTDNDLDDAAPSWSPDGAMLAYHSYEQGVMNIHLYDLNSRRSRPLTREPLPVRFPHWTPDGRYVLATQEIVVNTQYEGVVIDARTGQIVQRIPNAQGLRAYRSNP
jgi:tol-pal system beta propeller repeat protein TolB